MSTSYLLRPELEKMIADKDVAEMQNFCSSLQPSSAAEFLQALAPRDAWIILQTTEPAQRDKIFRRFDLEYQAQMIEACPRDEIAEFCSSLHPATIAECVQLLDPKVVWDVFNTLEITLRAEIFSYFERDFQVRIVETCPRDEVVKLLEETPSDDRADLLAEVDPDIAEEIMRFLSKEDQQDVELLGGFDESKCGAEMSSDFVRLRENMTVREAIDEISAQTHLMETVYYLYVLDSEGRLVGVVSAKELLRRINAQDVVVKDFMKSVGTLITVEPEDDREKAVQLVEKYDLIAIPVVDPETGVMLGVITHDDVLEAAVEEFVENAHMSAAVAPLDDETYLDSNIFLLARKRFMWLAILLFGAITTALILKLFDNVSDKVTWLVAFLPMIVSTGGNSGGQSATLVITALATGEITLGDWKRIARRELIMGLILGLAMGGCGMINALLIYGCGAEKVPTLQLLLVPLSVLCVVFFSNLTGAMLPLLFQKLKQDPALMSNPFVAGISDTLGTFIYMLLAMLLVAPLYNA